MLGWLVEIVEAVGMGLGAYGWVASEYHRAAARSPSAATAA
jgi:hypothetical protein